MQNVSEYAKSSDAFWDVHHMADHVEDVIEAVTRCECDEVWSDGRALQTRRHGKIKYT
jgi:pentose-5-phosphate-3-epimerase